MVNFRLISDKYYNEYVNDDGTQTFPNNLTVFNPYLQGNQGELIKVIREVELSVTINELNNLSIKYVATGDATYGTFISESIDWTNEGLYNGATITVILNRGKTTLTNIDIDTISGENNSILRLEKASLTSLIDGEEYTDIVIKLESAPLWLTYKYGTIDVDATTPDFTSQIDGNEQAYYVQNIQASPTMTALRLMGNNSGSDLTTALEITYDGTGATVYDFQYTLEHTFRIPFYVEGEFGNLESGTIPRGNRPINMKYCSGFYFGNSDNKTIAFEDLGRAGNVGYFDQNFNGRTNNYEISNYTVTNSLGTGKIEATVTNTITFTLVDAATGVFSAGDEIILYHAKLPTNNEAQFKTSSFDTVWVFDSIRLTEGAGAASSTYWSNATMTLNAGNLDVSADISFPASIQDELANNSNNLVWATVANQNKLDPDTIDKVNVRGEAGTYSQDLDYKGIITAHQPTIYPESEFDAGTGYTNFDGYNGDLMGYEDIFTVDVTNSPLITAIRFMIVADDGTDYFELYGFSFPITSIVTVGSSPTQKQVLSIDSANDFNIPDTELINRFSVEATNPQLVSSTQTWDVKIGFQVPWREWISNQNVPTSFVDYAEVNNNQNNRTSNYSGGGYTIKAMLRVQTQVDQGTSTNSTFYELFSDSSTILDFDDAGAGTFSLAWNFYELNGDPTSDIHPNVDVQIDAVFTHSLGTLSTANLFGYIWIIPEDGTGQPWFLSTDLDLTNPSNPLKPTNSITPANTQFVEIDSTLNQVILRCQTEHDNINFGTDYIIYARLYAK